MALLCHGSACLRVLCNALKLHPARPRVALALCCCRLLSRSGGLVQRKRQHGCVQLDFCTWLTSIASCERHSVPCVACVSAATPTTKAAELLELLRGTNERWATTGQKWTDAARDDSR